MNNKKYVFFDIDGTLFDSIGIILDSFEQTFAALNEPFPGKEEIKKRIGNGLSTIFSSFFNPEQTKKAIQTYRNIYIPRQNAGIALVPRAQETLSALKNAQKIMGIFTMKMMHPTHPLLKQSNINQFFDYTIGAEHVVHGKPHPDGLLKLMDFFDAQAEDCVYIGDSLHDAHASRSAKMDFLAVLTGTATKKDFNRESFNKIFPSIYEAGKFLLKKD